MSLKFFGKIRNRKNRVGKIIDIKFLAFLCLFTPLVARQMFDDDSYKPLTIMLDPAGDSQNAGRILHDTFERGVAIQCAQKIKDGLTSKYRNMNVVFSHQPGEIISELHNANFANRLATDLYLSLHFCVEKKGKPKLWLYQFSYGNDMPHTILDLSFYPYEKAYLFSYNQTADALKDMSQVFEQESCKNVLDFQGAFSLPFKPLIGVKGMAIGIEMGIDHSGDWYKLLDSLLNALEPVIMSLSNPKRDAVISNESYEVD